MTSCQDREGAVRRLSKHRMLACVGTKLMAHWAQGTHKRCHLRQGPMATHQTQDIFLLMWQIEDCFDNVPFTRANCGDKINSAYLWFSKAYKSLSAQASRYLRKPQVLKAGNGSADKKPGILEVQIETWIGTDNILRDHMIQWIRGTWQTRIATEQRKQVECTARYLYNEKALSQESAMGPGPDGLESACHVSDNRRGIVDTGIVLSREPANTPCYTEKPTRPSR